MECFSCGDDLGERQRTKAISLPFEQLSYLKELSIAVDKKAVVIDGSTVVCRICKSAVSKSIKVKHDLVERIKQGCHHRSLIPEAVHTFHEVHDNSKLLFL